MGNCATRGLPSLRRVDEAQSPASRRTVFRRPVAVLIRASPVISEPITIVNALGLHARAAAKFVNLAKTFTATIELELGEKRADGKRIMNVMLLAAAQGTVLTLRTSGADEREAFDALQALVADRFGEAE